MTLTEQQENSRMFQQKGTLEGAQPQTLGFHVKRLWPTEAEGLAQGSKSVGRASAPLGHLWGSLSPAVEQEGLERSTFPPPPPRPSPLRQSEP